MHCGVLAQKKKLLYRWICQVVLQVGRNSAANTDYTKMEEWAKTNTKNRQKKKKKMVSGNKGI